MLKEMPYREVRRELDEAESWEDLPLEPTLFIVSTPGYTEFMTKFGSQDLSNTGIFSNHTYLLRTPSPGGPEISILDLNPENGKKLISANYEELRALSLFLFDEFTTHWEPKTGPTGLNMISAMYKKAAKEEILDSPSKRDEVLNQIYVSKKQLYQATRQLYVLNQFLHSFDSPSEIQVYLYLLSESIFGNFQPSPEDLTATENRIQGQLEIIDWWYDPNSPKNILLIREHADQIYKRRLAQQRDDSKQFDSTDPKDDWFLAIEELYPFGPNRPMPVVRITVGN